MQDACHIMSRPHQVQKLYLAAAVPDQYHFHHHLALLVLLFLLSLHDLRHLFVVDRLMPKSAWRIELLVSGMRDPGWFR